MAESIKIPIEIVDQFGKPLAYLNSSLGGAYKSVEKVNSAYGDKKKIAQIEQQAETCGVKTKGFFGSLQENFGISKGSIHNVQK